MDSPESTAGKPKAEPKGILPRDTHILIIEDSELQAKVLVKTLTDLGYRKVSTCFKPVEALALAQSSKPKLVICDWDMPGVTGIEVLKGFRANAELKAIPFLLMTAYADKDKVVEAAKSGANDYIVKPANAQVIEEKLRQVGKMMLTKRAEH